MTSPPRGSSNRILLLDPSQSHFLIVMGGPMSVNDEMKRSFLRPLREKSFYGGGSHWANPCWGFAWGAQLIASAMGAKVYSNRYKDIAWCPVQGVRSKDAASFEFPPAFKTFQWHGDIFDLLLGAVHLARSEACEHQAFQLGSSVVGLQFYLEATTELVRGMVAQGSSELGPDPLRSAQRTNSGRDARAVPSAPLADVPPDFFETNSGLNRSPQLTGKGPSGSLLG